MVFCVCPGSFSRIIDVYTDYLTDFYNTFLKLPFSTGTLNSSHNNLEATKTLQLKEVIMILFINPLSD